VIRGGGAKELRVLAERAQVPVLTTFMAKGALPADHPLMVTTVGLASEDIDRAGFPQADVIVAVGYDPVETGPARWNPMGRARLVHVDFTAAEVDARYQPEVEVVADVREALELLAPLVAVRPERKPPPPRVSDPTGARAPTRCSLSGSWRTSRLCWRPRTSSSRMSGRTSSGLPRHTGRGFPTR